MKLNFLFTEMFKEVEKWIETIFNREIIACYPNFLNNFQGLKGSSDDKYYNIKKRVNENKEYSRYE